jgi:hypothetical protein
LDLEKKFILYLNRNFKDIINKIPAKYPSASYSHVKFESTLIGWRVVVDFFFARQASAASVANKVTKLFE